MGQRMQLRGMALGLALALLGMAAEAQTRPGFEIGPELGWYSYGESAVTLAGPMAGAEASYTWKPGAWFLRAEASGDAAYVDYDSSVSGRASGIWDVKGEVRALAGGDVAWGRYMLTPFGGLGYRTLYDMEGGTTTNRVPTPALGYNRLSQYLYLPLGLSVGIPWRRWTVTPTVEGDIFLQGWQTSYIRGLPCTPCAPPGNFDSDITNTQSGGYGFRGRIMFATDMPWGRLSFGPFLRYWRIDQSNSANLTSGGKLVGIGFEPSNHTFESGIAVLFAF